MMASASVVVRAATGCGEHNIRRPRVVPGGSWTQMEQNGGSAARREQSKNRCGTVGESNVTQKAATGGEKVYAAGE